YSMPYNITMPQAAILVMQTDSMLHYKMYNWKMGPVFNARKLGNFPTGINDVSNSKEFKIFNTLAFAEGSGDALIELTSPSNIFIYDLKGRKIREMKNVFGQFKIKNSEFESGFYIITVENDLGKTNSKLIKF
ncbi:MAG: T9SS type A sorting domain-containing protein, partial [Bacteroidia bacterium]